jgi:hypothetical protein
MLFTSERLPELYLDVRLRKHTEKMALSTVDRLHQLPFHGVLLRNQNMLRQTIDLTVNESTPLVRCHPPERNISKSEPQIVVNWVTLRIPRVSMLLGHQASVPKLFDMKKHPETTSENQPSAPSLFDTRRYLEILSEQQPLVPIPLDMTFHGSI